MTNINVIGDTGYDPVVTAEELEGQELEQDDSAYGVGDIAMTSIGAYDVHGAVSEADVADALGLDMEEVYVRNLSYKEDAPTSASANRVNEEQINELGAQVGSPVAILNGKVQEREGQSTETIYQSEFANDPIDRID